LKTYLDNKYLKNSLKSFVFLVITGVVTPVLMKIISNTPTKVKKTLFPLLLGLVIVSCEKIPYEQDYVWENNTDSTFILYANLPENPEHKYFPVTASDNIWPPMVTAQIEPHSKYILHGTMNSDYYDKWFSIWVYPPKEGAVQYWGGPIKYINTIGESSLYH